MTVPPRRRAALGAALVASLLAAGCGGSGSADDGTVTLDVGLFGTFGFEQAGLYDEYMRLHPEIRIEETSVERSADYYRALQTRLAAGSGLADVQGIEIGFVADVVQNHADAFVDFAAEGNADELLGHYYDWKVEEATTSDGRVIGLGTDAGPEAMCFRRDLFEQAGLPTDRAQLAQLWSTWEGYLEVGRQYEASPTKPEGTSFVDSPASVFSAAVYQGETAYDDADGNPIPESSDGVATAWQNASVAAAEDMTANLIQFGDEWNAAFASGAFATISCPAWMLGYISEQAGEDASGAWDVAPLPGGAGNWGGSWLGVTESSEHKEEAIALVQWLTAPEQQIRMFTEEAHFPSSQEAAEDPQVADAVNEYFSGAPVGQIFGDSAAALRFTPIGPYDTQIQEAFTNALSTVAQGTAPDDAFQAALAEIEQITGG
ncbi:cellobiose transport system substrate-binding protein [Geodermatophilus normandii]|uniref:Cellobiose transport system substrate-binding protein n=1 Tax=Geodermatophilus normandii TaxID=1137989 RepID=A0A317QQG5_9ACTN|nr:extracellular solute-binding protein [Geodermatophilus normandii]PWW24936.1 cellobiose transport system substrate-binding protein [Geodermatophilus normandii]